RTNTNLLNWFPFPSRITFPGTVVLPVVPKCTTPNRENDVYNGNSLPVGLDVIEKTSLARVAAIAEHSRLIAPPSTVWVARSWCLWPCPVCWAHVREVAIIRGLTASRLMLSVKIVHRGRTSLKQPLTNVTVNQIASNLAPVVVDPVLQPIRVVPEPVLPIPPAGEDLAGDTVGDHEGTFDFRRGKSKSTIALLSEI
ncbi:isoleucine--tRNA ligase, partial [Striga asiatica]